jgi:large subunit ribosomal protein L16
MDGVPTETAREAMRLAAHKMPFRSRFITKHD